MKRAIVILTAIWIGQLTTAEARKQSCSNSYADCISVCNTYQRGPRGSPAYNQFIFCMSRCDSSYKGSLSTERPEI
jgi:hypothetical protein